MAESPEAGVESGCVHGSKPLQQESSLPHLQEEDSDDEIPELLEDSDSEGVPELIADLSDYDDMPELTSGDVSDDDEEPPPLVAEDSDASSDSLPKLIRIVTEKEYHEEDRKLISIVRDEKDFEAHTAHQHRRYHICLQLPGRFAVGNLEGFGVTRKKSSTRHDTTSIPSLLDKPGLVTSDPAAAPAEPLRRPVDCPKLGDRGLVRGEERPVIGPGGPKQAEPQEWSTGLFDCCADVPSCLLGALCPCILYGRTHRLVTGRSRVCSATAHFLAMLGGACLGGCFLCHWGYAPCAAAPLRSVIRGKYGLAATGPFELASEAEGRLADCFVHYWCHPCALCQEYREVKLRTGLEAVGTYTAPPIVEEMEKRVITEPLKGPGAKEAVGGVYYTLLAGE